ncbi:MAG: hypothetical protein HETSPECPRED_000939 [Heterodermia speciosa]|uniref:Zn(2)-C6 fungal-type domain-containing protein n=1 Tax=Heterodermia speciosa TaxID=116794 RepID=A0A8H3IDZ5_9LECA|nr:MAG: hypothetical protein HETSPECPRED_000939 [Heterodermia speciosa]
MSSDPTNQGQYPPPQWESQQQQRGAYPIAQQALNFRPPPSSQPYPNPPPSAPGDMVTLPPPQHQEQGYYRHPPPYDMYGGHPQDPMRGPPPPHLYANQPAPRQRTAIACRYCRRRKIRCSGFEASEDGRCTNCQRFQQECIFTPVSSQAQAFVPAHTAYPHLRNAGPMPPQRGGRALYPQQGQPAIYGAHGQPLGNLPPQGVDPHYQHPPPQGYPMQSPTAPYQGQVYDERGPPQPAHPGDKVSRKRPRSTDDPHPAVPPPQPPQTSSSHQYQGRPPAPNGRRGSGGNGGFEYPDPTGLVPVSPASSSTSYTTAPYPAQHAQPYYGAAQPQSGRRSSPSQSSHSYDPRASGSPHGSTSSSGNFYPGGLHPPQVLPDRTGRTPPPTQRDGSNSGSAQRAGMAVRDLLGPNNEAQRSNADNNMLKKIDRKGM